MMALTILEALSKEKPCGGKLRVYNESLEPMYSFVKRHMAEIEEARTRGYSWKQIDAACRNLWSREEAGTDIVWWKNQHMIASCYKAVKRQTTTKRAKPQSNPPMSRKYNIEVTEA